MLLHSSVFLPSELFTSSCLPLAFVHVRKHVRVFVRPRVRGCVCVCVCESVSVCLHCTRPEPSKDWHGVDSGNSLGGQVQQQQKSNHFRDRKARFWALCKQALGMRFLGCEHHLSESLQFACATDAGLGAGQH